jgi:hypothetical protein
MSFLSLSKFLSCSSLFQTAEMLSKMIPMKYNTHQLSGAAAFIGLFTFLLIINESFCRARKNLNNNNNDQEIDSFMFEKFLCWIGKVKVLLNDINLRDIFRSEKSE